MTFLEDELAYLRTLRFLKSDFIDFLTLFRFQRKFISVDTEGEKLIVRAIGPQVHVSLMAMDNRDYYRDRLRKKSGYVEKASFRVPVSELKARQKPKPVPVSALKTRRNLKPAPPSFWVWPIRIVLMFALFLFLRWLRK